jgi:CheY-like chemotaxis protein
VTDNIHLSIAYMKLNCILVIDDDEPTNFFSRMIIEESGCTNHIRIMESGRDALEYISKSRAAGADPEQYPEPDLILLDINMPAMNGWEFLEEYKKLGGHERSATRTIMLTTSLFPEDRIKASHSPEVSGFENKPITVEKLENIIRSYFP